MVEAALALALTLAVGAAPPTPAEEEVPDIGGGLSYSFVVGNSSTLGDGPTKISVIGQLPTPTWGYYPVLVGIDNTTGPAQTINFSFAASQGTTRTFTKSVEVRAGERMSAAIPVPSHLRYGLLHVRGPGITGNADASLYFNVISRPQVAVINIGSSTQFEKLAGVRAAYSGGNAQVVTIAAGDAPSEVAAYVGQDTVVVSSDYLQLSEAQRRALEEYAALGGRLVLSQSMRGLQAALPLLEQNASGLSAAEYGLGEVGSCERCTPEMFALMVRAGDAPVKPSNGVLSRPTRYYMPDDEQNQPVAGFLLPIARAPVGRFLLIIALFTLAIGPGSFFVARRRGPSALLVTIPATALITCVLIVGYSLARDGFSVHTSVQGFTLLDSQRHRALTASVAGFYANLSPGSARFPPGALVISPASYSYGDAQNAASINWTEGSKLGADFLPSRTYLEWGFLASQQTRARVVVKTDGTTVKVQNALGGHVEQLKVMVNDHLYVARDLDEGQEKVATAGTEGTHSSAAFTARAGPLVNARMMRPLKELDFVAVLDGPGFTPLGGLTLTHDASRHVVMGQVER